ACQDQYHRSVDDAVTQYHYQQNQHLNICHRSNPPKLPIPIPLINLKHIHNKLPIDILIPGNLPHLINRDQPLPLLPLLPHRPLQLHPNLPKPIPHPHRRIPHDLRARHTQITRRHTILRLDLQPHILASDPRLPGRSNVVIPNPPHHPLRGTPPPLRIRPRQALLHEPGMRDAEQQIQTRAHAHAVVVRAPPVDPERALAGFYVPMLRRERVCGDVEGARGGVLELVRAGDELLEAGLGDVEVVVGF
ncbi:hypothetical protein M426DRAFT_260854, partial [Hypoxylon sp. CI-4A]